MNQGRPGSSMSQHHRVCPKTNNSMFLSCWQPEEAALTLTWHAVKHSSTPIFTGSLTLPSLLSDALLHNVKLIQKQPLKKHPVSTFSCFQNPPSVEVWRNEHCWWQIMREGSDREWVGAGVGREGKGNEGRLKAVWDIPLSYGNPPRDSQTALCISLYCSVPQPHCTVRTFSSLWKHLLYFPMGWFLEKMHNITSEYTHSLYSTLCHCSICCSFFSKLCTQSAQQ